MDTFLGHDKSVPEFPNTAWHYIRTEVGAMVRVVLFHTELDLRYGVLVRPGASMSDGQQQWGDGRSIERFFPVETPRPRPSKQTNSSACVTNEYTWGV